MPQLSGIIGQISEFNVLRDDWTCYVERLDQLFTANGIEDEKVKTATLITKNGDETYKLLRDL